MRRYATNVAFTDLINTHAALHTPNPPLCSRVNTVCQEKAHPRPRASISFSLSLPLPPMELKANTPTAEPDRHLVVFAPGDTEDPKNWPSARKWAVTNVLSITGFNRILVSTIMAPALSRIEVDLNMTSTESAMALSIYLLATAFGPLIIGPFSEVYGRQTILHASSFWFLIWNLACGFATSKELLIASRFLAGFGASAIYALAGGVLGDVWSREQRGKSLGVYLLIPLLGAAVGRTAPIAEFSSAQSNEIADDTQAPSSAVS